MGDAAASVGAADPVCLRLTWGAVGGATPAAISTTFVHPSAVEQDLAGRVDLSKTPTAIGPTRKLSKHDMLHNTALPEPRVNPQTFDVFIGGERAWCEPLEKVALGQLYLLM